MDQSSAITLLFDFFSMESRNLYESFKNAGVSFTAAVIEDDGFLPQTALKGPSAFELCTGDCVSSLA